MDANKQEDIWEMLVDEEKQNRWIGFGGEEFLDRKVQGSCHDISETGSCHRLV